MLELAKPLGSVSQACTIMGYSRDNFYRSADPVQHLPRDWDRAAPGEAVIAAPDVAAVAGKHRTPGRAPWRRHAVVLCGSCSVWLAPVLTRRAAGSELVGHHAPHRR